MHHTIRSRTSTLCLIAVLGLLGAGCSSTPAPPEQKPADVESRTPGAVEVKPTPGDRITPVDLAPEKAGKLPPELSDPKNILSKRSIYFDYDKYEIRDEFKDLIAAHAKFLVARRDFRMLIQGNADERGSREYNLALGQKRADAVKKALILLGAREDQVESVSLGEEKPKAEGHDEAAWAENRRGDMLYGGEY